MKKIDEQIKWYEQNATRKDDELIKANLSLIEQLYDNVENSEDKIFLDKIIATFCEIIEIQRGVIDEVIAEAEKNVLNSSVGVSNYIPLFNEQSEFTTDKQLQDAFTVYCLQANKSSYTINDYCSRIKNLWKTFYKEYKDGQLSQEMASKIPDVLWDGILMNVYDNINVLQEYISDKITEFDGNRNWANTRAAFNKFEEFIKSTKTE